MIDAPSIHWKKFFDRFLEIDSLDISKWKEVHLLSYFCRRYEKHYGVSYTWDLGKAKSPSKSYEVYRLHSLMHMISSDPGIIRDYIDWFFDHKLPAGKRITSLALVVDAKNAAEFKFTKLAMNPKSSIGRTTTLPSNYQSIVDSLGGSCRTYGDLAFLSKVGDDLGILSELKKAGLDIEILSKVS